MIINCKLLIFALLGMEDLAACKKDSYDVWQWFGYNSEDFQEWSNIEKCENLFLFDQPRLRERVQELNLSDTSAEGDGLGGGGAGMLTSPQIPTNPLWGGNGNLSPVNWSVGPPSVPSVRPSICPLRLSVCLSARGPGTRVLGPWARGPKRIRKYRQH